VTHRVRRSAVAGAVVASLLLGLVSIRVAAHLAEAAGPPSAPPISMSELTARLSDEESRAAALQAQLQDLVSVTDQLRAALAGTAGQVSLDGLTADQLRARLRTAEDTLAKVTALLAAAQARLAALGAGSTTGSGGGGGGGGNPPGGTGATTPPGVTPGATSPAPTPGQTAAAFTLAVSAVSGGVRADWTVCGSTPFDSYALIRSSIAEVHWPPETGNTQVARIASVSTTTTTDAGAPSGKRWYQLFCLVKVDGEVKIARTSPMVSITLP
jgi:hypothetical protein